MTFFLACETISGCTSDASTTCTRKAGSAQRLSLYFTGWLDFFGSRFSENYICDLIPRDYRLSLRDE